MTRQYFSPRTKNIILWTAQVFLAAFFMMGALMKFMPIEKISAMMPWTGQVPAWIVRVLGLIDLTGAAGLMLPGLLRIKPQLTFLASIGIILMMICAIIFHVSRGEESVIGINVFCIVLAVFVAWRRSGK